MIKINKNLVLCIYDSKILTIGDDVSVNLNVVNMQICNADAGCVMVYYDGKWYQKKLFEHLKQWVDNYNIIKSKSCPIVWFKGNHKNVTYPFDDVIQYDKYFYDKKGIYRFQQITKTLQGITIFDDGCIKFVTNDNQVAAMVRPLIMEG